MHTATLALVMFVCLLLYLGSAQFLVLQLLYSIIKSWLKSEYQKVYYTYKKWMEIELMTNSF